MESSQRRKLVYLGGVVGIMALGLLVSWFSDLPVGRICRALLSEEGAVLCAIYESEHFPPDWGSLFGKE